MFATFGYRENFREKHKEETAYSLYQYNLWTKTFSKIDFHQVFTVVT